MAADGTRLLSALRDVGATVVQATPTTWRMLLASGWQGQAEMKVLCGGEPLDPSLAAALVTRCASLWNMYRPTETTVWSSLARIVDPQAITIGRPIRNTQMYILDAAMQPVPIGVPGDLYIGGLGLADGYYNYPELTATRFLPNPFDSEAETRLYWTGDRARYLVSGEIAILGRLDHQIKLRGHRIELGEIEAVLLEHPAVVQAAVVVNAPADDIHRHLMAYLVCGAGTTLSISALRSCLGERLPSYMIPASFVYLDVMAMTPNGKVDRNALARLNTLTLHERVTFIPPRDFVEVRLVEIWEQVLDVKPLGIRDNFFDLGGHSLLAVHLFLQIEVQLSMKLPVVTLFQSPTIEQLGAVIKRAESAWGWDSLVPITTSGSELPFFCVHGVGGGVLDYAGLAELLGPEYPFYALQARGGDGVVFPTDRIEDMAKYYIKGIQSVRPAGPYALGGYSFGGVVAFEMACQLHAMGEHVALLAMLETYAPGDHHWPRTPTAILRFIRNLPRWVGDIAQHQGSLTRLWSRIRFLMSTTLARRSVAASVARSKLGGGHVPLVEQRPALVQAHIAAVAAYRPRVYPGHVTLFRVPGMALLRAWDPQLGWGEIAAGGVTVKMIPGAHYSILESPQVATLAEQLRISLVSGRHSTSFGDGNG